VYVFCRTEVFLVCSIPHPVTFHHLGSDVLHTTLFKCLHSLAVGVWVSHPYEARGKIIVWCSAILIFSFLDEKQEDQGFQIDL
jgi:hypothetical protein